jgi:hypothetical protein
MECTKYERVRDAVAMLRDGRTWDSLSKEERGANRAWADGVLEKIDEAGDVHRRIVGRVRKSIAAAKVRGDDEEMRRLEVSLDRLGEPAVASV